VKWVSEFAHRGWNNADNTPISKGFSKFCKVFRIVLKVK